MSGVFPTLVAKTIDCIRADEESGNEALGSLSDLIEVHPKFIRPILNDLVNVFTEIMESKLSTSLRIKACNGIFILS